MEEIIHKRKHKIEAQNQSNSDGPTSCFMYTLKRLNSSSFYKPFACIGVLYGLTQFNGIPVLVTYLRNIFQESGSGIDPALGTIFVGLARVATALCSSLIMLKFPKRNTFVVSTFLLGLSMASIAGYKYAQTNMLLTPDQLKRWNWIPLAGAVMSMVTHALGIITTLHILMAESFPTEIRSVACGITQTSYNFLHVISVRIYPSLRGKVLTCGLNNYVCSIFTKRKNFLFFPSLSQ